MSMVGREYPSELSTYKDPKTGREVVKLTNQYTNFHLYFSDNSFTLGDEEIYFVSSRPHNDKKFNYFKMNLNTGIMTQITDESNGIVNAGGYTKTPDSEYLIYISGQKVIKINTRNGEQAVIYEGPEGYTVGSPFISPDKKYVGVTRNEKRDYELSGPNYAGFKEGMFYVKNSYVTLIKMDGSDAVDVFADTHQIGHLQFAPDDSTLLSYCHEGPWNYIHQRIWLLDTVTRKVKPCFRQREEDDCVGHEFWTRDGLVFFDNRRKGHDGTITSDRTQAVTAEVHSDDPAQTPYVGFADKSGNMIRKIELPYYCNHYHANGDNSLLVGDEVDDLVLIDLNNQPSPPQVLCHHGTSWAWQYCHCHPTWSWSSDKILFASDREGNNNLYYINMK